MSDDWRQLTHRVYNEDGYCVCCGNGYWKKHAPECGIADDIEWLAEEES